MSRHYLCIGFRKIRRKNFMELYEKQRRKAETVLPVNIFFLLFVKHQYQNSKREKENKKKAQS